jgi:hypothetical protein
MTIDSIYDFGAIKVDQLAVDLRRLALDAARHVLGDAMRPALTADESQRLAHLVLRPSFGNAERRRAEQLLLRPLRLTPPKDAATAFGPLEMVAASTALSRLSRWNAQWRKLKHGGVESGPCILKTIARLAFNDPGFREELSLLVTTRLARDVVLWPRLALPVPVDDAALLGLAALVVPRPGRQSPRGAVRRVEEGLIRCATDWLTEAPAHDYGAWMLAEAAERHLALAPPPASCGRWWHRTWRHPLVLKLRGYLRWLWPKDRPLPFLSAIDRSSLIALAAGSPMARQERFPMLFSHRKGEQTPDSLDDGIRPLALRLYLIRHF